MLQSTINTSVYKKYGLVIPRENNRARSMYQYYNMAPGLSGQTPMEAFHSTKNSEISESFRKSESCWISEKRTIQPKI